MYLHNNISGDHLSHIYHIYACKEVTCVSDTNEQQSLFIEVTAAQLVPIGDRKVKHSVVNKIKDGKTKLI